MIYKPDAHTETAIVEVKARLSAIREVRDALVQLVKLLVEFSEKRAYLVLIDSRISISSLEQELKDFKAAIRSDVANRLYLVTVCDGEIKRIPPGIAQSDLELLRQQVEAFSGSRYLLPRQDMQSEVLRVLLHQWILGKEPMKSNWLAKTVGCSYRTVVAMIEKLGPAVDRLSDRRVQLKYFPKEVWSQFLVVSQKARATIRYMDCSGQPRSPESLVRRLQRMDRMDLAIGGVFGAKWHFQELDIVSAPRLDICIHCLEKNIDLQFVQKLDPALRSTRDPYIPVSLALHFIRRKESFFVSDSGNIWADPVECLADLYESRLDQQASQFEAFLSERGDILNGKY